MVVPTHGQWWSNFSTQSLLTEQWCARGGWKKLVLSFHFSVTFLPFTTASTDLRLAVSAGWPPGALRGRRAWACH